MARTPSNMLALGTKAPAFSLPDTLSGNTLSLDSLASDKATLIMFICNHCPFVIHVLPELQRLAADYQEKGISIIAISSNDVDNYPQDGPDKMKVLGEAQGWDFPYLYDESQEVARAYEAACTPDFYLFDKDLSLVYRGQLDASRPGNQVALNGEDLRAALDAVLAGESVNENQMPSLGCNIKWK
ncbi:MAG: thioredoxin family protein [Bacteroidota bacterium]